MGRSKLPMEYITSEKARNSSFKKRKEGLMKKISELSILCGIDACLIIYGPRINDETPMEEVHQWPKDSKEVESVLKKYELKRNESSSKHLNLIDFYGIQTVKINEQISKTRREIAKAKFAKKITELELKNLSVDELQNMLKAVDVKIETVTSRIESEKEKQRIMSRGIGAVELMKLDDENSNSNSNTHIVDSSDQFVREGSKIETGNEYFNAQTYLDAQVTEHFKPLHQSVSDFNAYLPLQSLTDTFLTQSNYQTDLMAGYIPTFIENDRSEYAIGASGFGQFQSSNWEEPHYFETSLYNTEADGFKSYGMGYESVGSYLAAQQQQQQQSVLTSVLQGSFCCGSGDCHCNICGWQRENGTSDS